MKNPLLQLSKRAALAALLLASLSWGAGLLCPATYAYNFTVGLTGTSVDGVPFSKKVTVNESNPFTLLQGEYLQASSGDCHVQAGYKNRKPYSYYEYLGIGYSYWMLTPVPQTEYCYHDIEKEKLWSRGGSNLVTTICGETFSRFYNLTGQNLTINYTTIPSNTSTTIDSPWYVTFSGAGTNNYSLVSARTGQQLLTLTDNGKTNTLCSADDIVVLRQSQIVSTNTAPVNATIEGLLYGDIKSENQNKILYASNEAPLFVEPIPLTNIYLNTEWVFGTNVWGASPQAIINGEIVCHSHTTSHIIEYQVNTTELKASSITGECSFLFTMSQIPEQGYNGGYCIMRCWSTEYSEYGEAPYDKHASKRADTGTATFKVKINATTGKWRVSSQ